MKALVATGDPEQLIGFAEVEQESPAAGVAVVQVEAFSVNRGDFFQLSGVYGTPPPAGFRPGQDIAGRVLRAATDGTGPAVGARVVGHVAQGWAEQVAAPVTALAELPDRITVLTAAALPLAGLTALRLIRAAGSLAGRRILLTGASGGVGHYLVELAAAAGAEVTAVSSTAERGSRLLELGATAVIGDPAEAVGRFDLVMESVGGDSFAAALARLAPRGTLLWFGEASRTPVTMDFFDVLARGAAGATIRHFSHAHSDLPDSEDLATLVRLVATGRLHPEIGRSADWSETARTLIDLSARRIRGNAVLTVPAAG
jgi:NADPH:quinone reductase